MSNKLFKQHLATTIRRYPSFRIMGEPNKQQYLKGILDIPDETGNVVCAYSVEIRESFGYPYRYPYAFEVGGDIPRLADYHKYSDDMLCLGVDAEEIIKCRNGLHVTDFISEVLIPYLANQYYRRITGHYLQEYAHGTEGIKQCYSKILNNVDEGLWPMLYHMAFIKSIGRNDLCCCGSGKKYKFCHESEVNTLILIGKKQVDKDFTLLRLI